MTRDDQIEALARRIIEAWAALEAGPEYYQRIAPTAATIAIELAEATREAAAKVCDQISDFERQASRTTSRLNATAMNIRLMLLPIADGNGDG